MITSVTSEADYSLHFSICTDEARGLLWLEVVIYEKGNPRRTKDFAGNEYDKAIGYYRRLQAEFKKIYG